MLWKKHQILLLKWTGSYSASFGNPSDFLFYRLTMHQIFITYKFLGKVHSMFPIIPACTMGSVRNTL